MPDSRDGGAEASIHRQILEATAAVPWQIDAATRRFMYVGPQIERMLGFSRAAWPDLDALLARVHEADRDAIATLFASGVATQVDFEVDFAVVSAGGRTVPLRMTMHVVRDARGRPRSFNGFLFDRGAERTVSRPA